MFKIVKCKGVLLKAMTRNIQQISILSFFIITIPLIILALSATPGSVMANIAAYTLGWYMLSIFISSRSKEYGVVQKLITFPMFLSLKLSVLIFRFFLIKKYPEMEEEHYERWVKLQRLKSKINKQHFIW